MVVVMVVVVMVMLVVVVVVVVMVGKNLTSMHCGGRRERGSDKRMGEWSRVAMEGERIGGEEGEGGGDGRGRRG